MRIVATFVVGGNMKVKEILELDCREEENRALLQKALFRIPVIAKKCSEDKEVPLSVLEKVASTMSRKYYINISCILPVYVPNNGDIYKAIIVNCITEIGTMYGCSIYEVVAKAVICMYSNVEKSKVLRRKSNEA